MNREEAYLMREVINYFYINNIRDAKADRLINLLDAAITLSNAKNNFDILIQDVMNEDEIDEVWKWFEVADKKDAKKDKKPVHIKFAQGLQRDLINKIVEKCA